jgi:hypothetical protein
MAARALPAVDAGESCHAFIGGHRWPGFRRLWRCEKRAAAREGLELGTVSEEAEVPDADEPWWEHVQQEAPDELLDG